MKTPISLQRLADSIGAHIEPLNFKAHGRAMRGWAIVDSDNNELLECEPINRNTPERWILRNRCTDVLHYVGSIREVKNLAVKAKWTGYKFRSLTTGSNGRMLKAGVIV